MIMSVSGVLGHDLSVNGQSMLYLLSGYAGEDMAVNVSQEQQEATYENQLSTSVPVEEFWEHVKNKMASDGFKKDFAVRSLQTLCVYRQVHRHLNSDLC